MADREVVTEDGRLKFLVSDPLEEYRARTILTKEPETIAWIDSWRRLEPSGDLQFWDIGSNIGMYTLYAAAVVPDLHVVSYEPYFKNFMKLKANISLNKMDNVTPVWIALSNTSGIARFGVQDERHGASGNVLIAPAALTGVVSTQTSSHFAVTESVLQATGDDLLNLNLCAPSFLKIDVDGIELEIVEGMPAVLASDSLRSVLVEINSAHCLERIGNLLAIHGFSPDEEFNNLANHSRNRRSLDATNTAQNWVFTRKISMRSKRARLADS